MINLITKIRFIDYTIALRTFRFFIPKVFMSLSCVLADGYKLHTFQVAISQKPISSDSLVLRGTLGSNFYQTSSGDTLAVKGGFWNI
ncbi:uncharacterized protein METZ01_LOCUS429811, partial [marine metagenome]